MLSPVTRDSHCGSRQPPEDNAGPRSERYQSSGNNSLSPAPHALALYASAHSSCTITKRLFISAYNAEYNYKQTLETVPGQLAR